MEIHVTRSYNMGGTATLAQDGVIQVARELGCREMPVERRSFYDDYWNQISHHLDGVIAPLRCGDVVIFQYPSWNGPDYDWKLVQKIRLYEGTKLVIFVHDFQKLMFDSEESILHREIEILNYADILILPSEQMYHYLVQNGVKERIPVFFQKIWEAPGFPEFTRHENLKRLCFTGEYSRFPFLKDYAGKTRLEQFSHQCPERTEDESFCWKGGYSPVELMCELARGGYGLVWCDREYFERYYSLNQPHKLGFDLAAGIPVIVRAGSSCESFIRKNGLGIVVRSLEEADTRVRQMSDENYAELIRNVAKIQKILLRGMYTKKLLSDVLVKTMEG